MSPTAPRYPTVEDVIGNTPLVRLVRVAGQDNDQRGNVILGKLEGNNPAGSVKDRPAISMIRRAEERGDIKPGDTLIEATSGNTGIALAMAAAIRGYRMLLIMPDDLSIERAQTMKAFGAELILTPRSGLPGIQYYTGQRLDLGRITAAAHRAGAMAGFDLAHAAGNVPLALHDWDVDFAAWCSYKYLNGWPGAPGGCFVHERHGANQSLPRLAGWWGNDPASRFRLHLNERFVPQEGADGWQISNPSVFSMTPLLASMAQFDRIGMAALRKKSLALTGYLEFLIGQIPAGRVSILTPPDPEARGCQLSLLIPEGARAAFDAIRARGILPDFRQPDVIRMSPAPMYNSFHDVWRAGTALAEVLGA